MRKNTKAAKKTAPLICTAVVLALLGLYLAVILLIPTGELEGELPVLGIVAVYTVVIAAVAVGVLLALRQRLKEIDGGEEEDAKKY